MNNYDTVSGIKIAYIGGGSRGWAWNLMKDLAVEKQISGEVCLYDIDYEAAKANEFLGNQLLESPDCLGKWHYTVKKTVKEALAGADFVVISILPGTFDEMESDVHAPEKYGIYQSVGDTVGPGGILRGMRTIPVYAGFAEAIASFCPNAWVINYTNPMSVCTSSLYRVFPRVKAFGCCHEVFSSQHLFACMLEEKYGIKNINREEIILNVMGINHFTWFDQVNWKNIDLVPLFAEFAEKYAQSGYAVNEAERDPENYFRNINKVGFDLFRRFRLIPVSGDRHISEFMPPWYLKDVGNLEKNWGFALTPVSYRRKNRERLVRLSRDYRSGKKRMTIKESGEEGVRQMKALLGLGDFVTNVNLPNAGQMQGLPEHAVVETNAVLGKDSVKPVFAGRLPDKVNMIVSKHAMNQESLVTAAINKDIEHAFSVFLNDNLMTLDIDDAAKLFREMVRNTAVYLDGWEIGKI